MAKNHKKFILVFNYCLALFDLKRYVGPPGLAKWVSFMAVLPYLPKKNLCNGHLPLVLNPKFRQACNV
jgi:hypothetical protein